jgi:hypothetical protein
MKDLVGSLPPQDLVAFLVFAGQVERKIDFTHEREPILQQLDDLQARSTSATKGTALWDVIPEALGLFDSPLIGDSVYVITDGVDTESHAAPDDAERMLLAAGVRFFAVLPPAPARARLDRARTYITKTGRQVGGPADLKAVADTTGGALFTLYSESINGDAAPLKPTELRVALDQLNAMTEHFYRVEMELAQPVDKVRDWQLEVTDPSRRGKLRLETSYPRKLVPCEASGNLH